MAPLTVDVWSDVVCPWCYLGKRRLEAALAAFDDPEGVEVTWHAFELDPDAPPVHEGRPAERLAEKYGSSLEQAEAMNAQMTELAAREGLEYHLDTARGGNSFDAHRLIRLAAEHGRQGEAEERMFRAYFTEGEAIGAPETLVRLGTVLGLDAEEVRETLGSDRFAADVREDEAVAARLGIRGVPFFVLDRRYGVSGAQPAEVLVQALEHARRGGAEAVA
jgi:predicted DsbA family dithiol-disulfide isomerase